LERINLIDRSKRLDKDAEYLVMKDYDRRNFYVHTGLAGIFNLSTQNFEQLCMFALSLIGECILKELQFLGQELKLSQAIGGYRADDRPHLARRTARARSARPPRDRGAGRGGPVQLNCDSGQQRGQRHIWGGRASVRATVYMATVSATRHNAVLAAFYRRLASGRESGEGRARRDHAQAPHILNAMMKHQRPWHPEVASTPVSPARRARAATDVV
jgi:hypothetical protein